MARPRMYGASFAARLIDHAGRVLAEEGPAALTVRRLAADLEASTGAIYRTIGTKDDLIRAMYLEGFARLEAELRSVPESLSVVNRLRELGFAYQRAALRSPHLYSVMFERPVPDFEPTEDDRALARASLDLVIGTVEAGLRSGALRRDLGSADDVAVRLWSVNHGVTSLLITGILACNDPRAHLAVTMDMFLDSLTAGATTREP